MIDLLKLEAVWLAMIVAASSTFGPVVVASVTARIKSRENQQNQENARNERAENYARQDLVAKRLQEATEKAASKVEETNNKLDIIHTLVNSNLTAAMQSEHDAMVRELAMIYEVIDLKKKAGHKPTVEALAAVKATETRLAELHGQIADRLKATEAAVAGAGPGMIVAETAPGVVTTTTTTVKKN